MGESDHGKRSQYRGITSKLWLICVINDEVSSLQRRDNGKAQRVQLAFRRGKIIEKTCTRNELAFETFLFRILIETVGRRWDWKD